jgi:hypothetical protein
LLIAKNRSDDAFANLIANQVDVVPGQTQAQQKPLKR